MAKPLEDKADAPLPPENAPPVERGHHFRDHVYTSRTLILPSGNALPVNQSRASAVNDEQLQYLTTHPDFAPITE